MKGKWKRFFQNHFEQISNSNEEGEVTSNLEEKTWDIPIIGQSKEEAINSIDLEKIRENKQDIDIPQLMELEEEEYEDDFTDVTEDIVEKEVLEDFKQKIKRVRKKLL